MYLLRFLNTPLSRAMQTFAPGGKYPRAATVHVQLLKYSHISPIFRSLLQLKISERRPIEYKCLSLKLNTHRRRRRD